jgi:aspartate-semialdehyde dehydrogenase
VSAPRFRTAILGGAGYIGQQFARLLADHPTFGDPLLVGSQRSVGRRLEEVWALPEDPPAAIATRRFRAASPQLLASLGIDLVFSALPSGIAGAVETALVRRGIPVFTNASDHRLDRGVPLLIPEVNPSALAQLADRPRASAPLVANPNCTATGLALALAPVWSALRPREVHVSTYQALSGAGLPGIASLPSNANVVPFIDEEEEKVARETSQIFALGAAKESSARFLVHAARVPVRDGHLESVTVVARRRPSEPPVLLRPEADRPQPTADLWAGSPRRARGMAVSVGRVRWEPPYLRLFLLSHNAVRGGAGGSVLNAEFALAKGQLRGR